MGNRYLLTCCDSLTGYLDGEPISSKSDKLVARALVKIILRHVMSGVCVSDNGKEFGSLREEIFERLNDYNLIQIPLDQYLNFLMKIDHV